MALHNFTLLYVEDDKNTQEEMKLILQSEVKVFYQAYNGEEGLAYYKEKKPDIIITDINMPVMSGLDMAMVIKNMDRSRPIVIVSAFDERGILLDAINICIDGFVVKPINVELLMERLELIAQNLQNKIDAQRAKEMVRKAKEEKLYELAHHDALTSIPNRFLFNQQLNMAISLSKIEKNDMSLFFIDLDNFKNINDSYGHKAGDAILVSVVDNIRSTIRKSDFLARIGGDEFALIVENVSSKECLMVLARKIIKSASTPIIFKGNHLQVSCSIGISMCIEGNSDREELIQQADFAMYQAKANGKSDFLFYRQTTGGV